MFNRDLTPFLDARQNQLQLEVSAGDSIDTKALGVLAADLALLIFVAQSGLSLHSAQVIALLIAFIISLVITIIAIWPRTYAGASTNMFDHPEYLTWRNSRLVKQLISDTEIAIIKNKSINHLRWIFCATSIIITLAGSIVLFIMLYFR